MLPQYICGHILHFPHAPRATRTILKPQTLNTEPSRTWICQGNRRLAYSQLCVWEALPTSSALTFLRKLMKRYPRPDAIITDRLRSYRAALRELGGSDASRNSPPSILPSTTTSTSDDPSVHGTISNSTAPLHSPSGVSSGRPNSLVLGGITQTCDFTLTVQR